MKRMIRVLLTTVALFIVAIPLVAFADSYPVKLEYQGKDVFYYPNTDYNLDDFYAEGNKIIETYDDGSTKTYICKSYEWDGYPTAGYFLDGKLTYNDEYGEYNSVYFDLNIPDGGIPEGTKELTISRDYYDGDNETTVSGKLKVKEWPKPILLEYKGADLRYYQNKTGDWVEGLETEGNIITETYSGGSTKTYKCIKYQDEGGETRYGYFLDGKVTYDEEDGYPTPDYFRIDNSEDVIPAGTEELTISREFFYGEEIKVYGKAKAKEYPKPVSLEYKGAVITYRAKDDWPEGFEKAGNKIIVKYSDGSSEKYICKKYKEKNGYSGEGYFLDGKVTYNDDGYANNVYFDLNVPNSGMKAGTKKLTVSREFWYADEDIKVSGNVNVKELPTPKFATFSGKTNTVYIGQKDLDISDLFKKDNKITVTYTDNSKVTYKYITFKKGKETWVGFYRNGNKKADSLWGEATIKNGLKKGTNKVTFTLYSKDGSGFKMKNVTFKASKNYAYTVHTTYVYTGKVIKPKIVVKNEKGKVIPAKNYKVTYINTKGQAVNKPWAKAYGEYDFKITFNKTYAKKYLNPVWGSYEIVPKTPTLSKVTAGSGKFTATWKKATGIDGYQIEYSTNKSFKDYDIKKIAKSKTSGTVTYLEKGKTYYVRVRTYKKVKTNGNTWECLSKPSAVKTVKVK